VLLNQVPSKTIDIRFTSIRKIIRHTGNRNKNIKKIVAGVLDTLLRELENMVKLLINKI
jgi:hypothetical protein